MLSRGMVAYGGAKYAFLFFIALFGGFCVSWCYFAICPLHGAMEKTTFPKSCMSMQGEASGFGIIGLPNKKTGVWVFVSCQRAAV